MKERAASLGELKRFAQKFGVSAIIDLESARFQDLGLRHARMSDDSWLSKLVEEPMLLKMPLVRSGNNLTIGLDETAWKSWTAK